MLSHMAKRQYLYFSAGMQHSIGLHELHWVETYPALVIAERIFLRESFQVRSALQPLVFHNMQDRKTGLL